MSRDRRIVLALALRVRFNRSLMRSDCRDSKSWLMASQRWAESLNAYREARAILIGDKK